MRMIGILLLITLLTSVALAGGLTDTYRNGQVRLVSDPAFGQDNNWQKLFNDHDSGLFESPARVYKNVIVADDGSAFVVNYSAYQIYIFDNQGSFVKAFGEEGYKDGQFRNRPTLHPILDNKYFFTSEHNGRLSFFNLDGSFYKVVAIDYMPTRCIPLKDGKIAVVGHVPYGGEGDVRNIVSIIDIDTGDENIVFSEMKNFQDEATVVVKTEKGMVSIQNPIFSIEILIRRTVNGNLIVGVTDRPGITIYSPDGRVVQSFDLQIEPLAITEQEKQEYYTAAKTSLAKLCVDDEEAFSVTKKPGLYPDFMPYYHSLVVDSDNNLLVFLFTNDDVRYRFQVYSLATPVQLVCETEFKADEYEYVLNAGADNLQFHSGFLYAAIPLKNGGAAPVRLLKLELVN